MPASAEAMQLAGRESLRLPNLWHPQVERTLTPLCLSALYRVKHVFQILESSKLIGMYRNRLGTLGLLLFVLTFVVC